MLPNSLLREVLLSGGVGFGGFLGDVLSRIKRILIAAEARFISEDIEEDTDDDEAPFEGAFEPRLPSTVGLSDEEKEEEDFALNESAEITTTTATTTTTTSTGDRMH